MRSVVIGGAGFLGGAIARELLRLGDHVVVAGLTGNMPKWAAHYVAANARLTAAKCDILDTGAIARTVKGADEVYHVAGVLGTSELNDAEAVLGAIDVNIRGAVAVFQACIAAGVSRVFYPTKPNVWLNVYSITKGVVDEFAALLTTDKTRIIRLRWFNAYGPGQHMAPVRKVLPTFCLCARFGLPLPIWGSGRNTTDMIYAEDVAAWSVAATRAGLSDQVYELGTGKALSVLDVALATNVVSRNNAGLRHLPMRSGEDENTLLVADVAPLRSALNSHGHQLGFMPWMEGLRRTYAHYAKLVPESEARQALEYHGLWI